MRITLFRSLTLVAMIALGFGVYSSRDLRAAPGQEPARPLEFNRDVRPILAQAPATALQRSPVRRTCGWTLATSSGPSWSPATRRGALCSSA